jgi:flagellar export protein FliJ
VAQRFVFRLETLLRVRTLREQEAKRKVGAKRAEIARVDQLNDATQTEIDTRQRDLRQQQDRHVLDPLELQGGRAWIAHLRRQIATRMQQKAGLQDELRTLRDALRQARTQTRVLEKLRERRQREYDRTRRRREQAEADELAQQLHQRQGAQAPAGAAGPRA